MRRRGYRLGRPLRCPRCKKTWRWRPVLCSVLVWSVLVAGARLDRHAAGVNRAEFFGWLVPMLAGVFRSLGGLVGPIILGTVESAIKLLARVVAVLVSQVKSFILSSGAMFARVWRQLEGWWKNAIRPALQRLHDAFLDFRKWLTRIFKPITTFLNYIRDKIHEIYRRFVRPVLDALDALRRVLDVLAKLHVPFARALDNYVTATERWIIDQYTKLNSDVTKLIDTVNGIVTLDGLLQRFTLMRSIERDVFYVWRALGNAHSNPLTDADKEHAGELAKGTHLNTVLADFTQYVDDGTGPVAALVGDATALWTDLFNNVPVDDGPPLDA